MPQPLPISSLPLIQGLSSVSETNPPKLQGHLFFMAPLPPPPVWVCASEISSFFGLYGCGLSSLSFSLWVCWGCGSGCVDLMGLPWAVENGGGCACNSSLGFVMVVEGQGGWVLWWWWKRKVVVADGAVVETVVAMADRGWLWLFFFFFF